MRRFLVGLFFSLIALLLTTISWYSLRFFFIPISKQPYIFVVDQGQSIGSIAKMLNKTGFLKDPNFFLLAAKWQGNLKSIKAGEYQIDSDMTPQKLLEKLVHGKVVLHKVTIVEGWNFSQLLNSLKANHYLSHSLKNNDPQAIMTLLGIKEVSPEGLFYPDTFLVALNTKDSKILQMSYNLMQKKLQRAWEKRDLSIPYKTPYDALIVASLIEKETAKLSERPLIAGVILKRMQIGMRLQIDASVIYGAGNQYQKSITKKILQTDTPYNTYTRSGLPPTPIGMPSISSIEAALHPVITDALYYVAKGDGSHVFTSSLKAHHVAVKQYIAVQKSSNINTNFKQSYSGLLLIHYWASLGI